VPMRIAPPVSSVRSNHEITLHLSTMRSHLETSALCENTAVNSLQANGSRGTCLSPHAFNFFGQESRTRRNLRSPSMFSGGPSKLCGRAQSLILILPREPPADDRRHHTPPTIPTLSTIDNRQPCPPALLTSNDSAPYLLDPEWLQYSNQCIYIYIYIFWGWG
jgi:hypothetical protein